MSESRPPRDVRDDIRNRISRELLVRSGIVHDAAPQQVAQLVSLARDVGFVAGATIQKRGERCRRFLVITEGEVELGPEASASAPDGAPDGDRGAHREAGGDPGQPRRLVGRGEAVGLVDALLDRPHSRTAVAIAPVRGLVVELAAYLDFLEQHFELTLGLLGRLATAVHEQLLRAAAALRPTESVSPTAEPEDALAGCTIDTDTTIGRLLVLRHLRPFAGASVQAQVSLANDARPHRLADGALLFRAGDPGDVLWMVARGAVTLSAPEDHGAGQTVPTIHCGPGDLVEHHAALAGGPRRFTATAVGDTVLLGIDREALLDRMDEHFDLTRSLLGFLGAEQERLR